MTPTLMTESGRAAPVLGGYDAGDRDGVAILDDQAVVLFVGCAVDADAFVATHGLTLDWDCERIENRGYVVGFEAF